MPTSKHPSDFDQIYQAAKSNDTYKLSELINDQNICIDVRQYGEKGFLTPAAKLAQEGNFVAVERLIRLDANRDWVSLGCTLGGHEKEAEFYRKKYNTDVNLMGYGYAAGEHHAAAKRCHQQLGANADLVASGYAAANDDVNVKAFQTEMGTIDIVKGYILAKEDDKVESFVIKTKDAKMKQALVNTIAKYYAIAGNEDMVSHYYDDYRANIDDIVQGYALGGHFEKAQETMEDNYTDINIMCEGLAISGYFNELAKHASDKKFDSDRIGKALAYAGHIEEAQKYTNNPKVLAKAYALSGNLKNLKDFMQYNENALPIEECARDLLNSGRFKNVDAMVRHLSDLSDDDFITNLCHAFQKLNPGNAQLKNLDSKIIHLKSLKSSGDFNYDQIAALANPETEKLISKFMAGKDRRESAIEKLVDKINKITPITKGDVKNISAILGDKKKQTRDYESLDHSEKESLLSGPRQRRT